MASVMLTFDSDQVSQLTLDVRKALDDRGVAYAVAFVDGYVQPRLTVGGGELIGDEILANLDRIQRLAQTLSVNEINDLARLLARSLSEQLRTAGKYEEEVWVDVPQIEGITPSSLRTSVWPDFSDNVQYARMDAPLSHIRYLHLKHFTLEIGDSGVYTGRASGRLIDDTWSL